MAAAFFGAIIFICVVQSLGVDTNSIFPRTVCFPQDQDRCNQEFTDAYPELSMAASNLTKADTFFMLFTRGNMDKPENLHKCGGRLPPDTNYNPANRLIVILTPFLAGYCDAAAYREWTAQILKREDANVLAIDYSWGNKYDYKTAIINNKIAANQTVVVLKNIEEDRGLDYSRLYVIGHSLGAQLAAYMGNQIKIGRITGIDPAGPGFAKKRTRPEDRLDPSDADLVDVWHTNAGKCLPNLGINYDAGHVDFWINGGSFQPACYKYGLISILKKDFLYGIGSLLLPTGCSHAFATEYFKVSINPGKCQFVGVKCKSKLAYRTGVCNWCGLRGDRCALMGFDLDKHFTKPDKFPQRYFVTTGLSCPYCLTKLVRLQGFRSTYKKSLQ